MSVLGDTRAARAGTRPTETAGHVIGPLVTEPLVAEPSVPEPLVTEPSVREPLVTGSLVAESSVPVRSVMVRCAGVVRRRLDVTGIVQGVGFRPFVHALARELGLCGHVGNDAGGVFIEIEGDESVCDEFARRLVVEHPPLAQITSAEAVDLPVRGSTSFVIVESTGTDGPRTLVPPDVATCDDCLTELADPADRRYRYPFVNCTNCGPRFTIIRDLPYDRPATTMAGFELCAACAAEYADPADRRYHAQPVACPACGPQLAFEPGGASSGMADPITGTDRVIAAVHEVLAAGGVVAVKGLGGYHLACDATNGVAVAQLRARKGRSDKPFAVMAANLSVAAEIAEIGEAEAATLTSAARPIVLLRRRLGSSLLAEDVAPGNPLVGVMLPYTPLHHLLFGAVPGAADDPAAAAPAPSQLLVMTSGNRSNEPICFDDGDARSRLADLADAFCLHDRPIEVPCDDSVVRLVDGEVQPIRRSRGFAPVPVHLPFEVPPTLGVGGELKNTCCVAAGRHAWVGQHIGDMENLATLEAFEASVGAFTTMYRVAPSVVGVDRHPGYLTRRWALQRCAAGDGSMSAGVVSNGAMSAGAALVDVQHHHAHVAAIMAEHGVPYDAAVLGVAFDGTGYGHGVDGGAQIWGGEVLTARYAGFERVAHLAPLPLPGGDEAVRNPSRIALAYLSALGVPLGDDLAPVAASDDVERRVVPRQVERGVGCVPTTSMGRLFDAVSSLLDVRHRVTYEAQAAIELEHLADRGDADAVELAFGLARSHGDRCRDDSIGQGGEPCCDHSIGQGGDRGSPPVGTIDVIDPAPVLLGIVGALRSGVAAADIAAAFHVAVADVVARVARRHAAGRPVALTGGVFQNALLTGLVRDRLERIEGLRVLTHRLVPPNDGGLSLGQAVIAGAVALAATAPPQPIAQGSS